MLELTILALTLYWMLGFIGRTIIPAHGSIDVLAIVIILLIMFRFLT